MLPSAPPITLLRHQPGAPALRMGLGPGLRAMDALRQLQDLFEAHSSWARGRQRQDLRRMLRHSQAVVSAWQVERLVGFGRATSDGSYRAVLWDVVVHSEHQGQGLGRRLVESLLTMPAVGCVERVYLMTTCSEGFYHRLGFSAAEKQRLMVRFKSG